MADQGDEAVTTIIQETDTEIAERFPIEMEEIGTDKKHMHLLCSAHPKMAPGRIMQMFKSIMALKIFRRKPAVRRVLWGGELWTGGYYVATVGSGQTGRPSNGTCSGRATPRRSPAAPTVLAL